MGLLLCAVLLAVVASLDYANCQSECAIYEDPPLWVIHDSSPVIFCGGNTFIERPKWWIVSDPCRQSSDSATELTGCSEGSCTVSNEQLMMPSSGCVVCCTDPRISSQFTINSTGSCRALKVCPEVTISAPTITTTGTDVDILTFVTTKPRPSPEDVSVILLTHGVNVTVTARGKVYPAPGGNGNNYTIVHTLELSKASGITEDEISVAVNISQIPHGPECHKETIRSLSINLIRVNSSGSTPQPNQNVTTPPITLDPSGISPVNDPLSFHAPSLAIGIAAGVGATLLVVVIVAGVIWVVVSRARASSRSRKSAGQFSGTTTGGSHPLLTANGTPATTPSSEVNQSLGQTTDTPASTPTELQDLLPGPTAANPYQEIHVNGTTRAPLVVGSSQHQSTSFARPPPESNRELDSLPPLPQRPQPPNPPRFTQVSGRTPSTQSLTDPQYHTQGEAMNLSQQYNLGLARV